MTPGDHHFVRVPCEPEPSPNDWKCWRCGFVTNSYMRPRRHYDGTLTITRSWGPVPGPDVEGSCDEAMVRRVMLS